MSSWKEFLSNSTIHGLSEIEQSSSRRLKVIYITVFLSAVGFTCYGCAKVALQFGENKAITTYFVQETDSLSIPEITICPFNRLKKSFLQKNNISNDLALFIQWAFIRSRHLKLDYVPPTKYTTNMTLINATRQELDKLLLRMGMSFEELISSASLQCRDVLQSCYERLHSAFDCCNHTKNVFGNLGRCFVVSKDKQNQAGVGQGIIMFIRLPVGEYVYGEDTALNDGIMMKLTEPGKGYDMDAIFIPPFVHALVQLRATKFEFMKSATSLGCIHDSEDSDYSPFVCSYRCILWPSYKECKCRYIAIPPDEGTRNLSICKPDQMYCVIRRVHAHIMWLKHHKGLDHTQECRRQCPPRCSYWQYHATVSHATYPSRLARKRFNLSMGEGSDQALLLEVYHEKLEYTLIKHVPMVTLDQLISDFGGQMGLWLGASILSLIHVLVFAFNFWCSHRADKATPPKGDDGRQGLRDKKEDREISEDVLL